MFRLLLLFAVALLGSAVPPTDAAAIDAGDAVEVPVWWMSVVRADGALRPMAGWRIVLGPTLDAGLIGPGPVRALAPWSAVADGPGVRCLVRTEARDADAVYVTVRIESANRLPTTSLLRWDVATGRWSDARSR